MAQRKHIVFDDDLNQQIIDLAGLEDRSFAWMVRALCREAIIRRTMPDPINEALNSGTGVYKP